MKIFNFLLKYKLVLLSSFLLLIVGYFAIFQWYTNGSFLYFWDELYPFGLATSHKFLYTWLSNTYPGVPYGAWNWLLYIYPLGLINSQEIIYTSLLFCTGFSFYLLINYMLKNILIHKGSRLFICIIFSIFYSLNLYSFYYAYFMFNPEAYIMAFLPLNILSLIRLFPLKGSLTKNRTRWILMFWASSLLMTPGFVTYIFFGQYLLWLGIYFLLFFLFSDGKLSLRKVIFPTFFLASTALLHWISFFPSLLTFRELYGIQTTVSKTTYFDANSTGSFLINDVRLIGMAMMANNPFSWSSFYENIVFTFPVFLLLFSVIYLLVKIKLIKQPLFLYYLLLMFSVSLFLVKEANPPFAWITNFAFKYIPFFDAFRDAYQKAGIFFLFSFMLLSAVGIALLFESLQKNKQRFLQIALFLLLIINVVIITGPFFIFSYDNVRKINFTYNNQQYTFSTKIKLPQEYYQLQSALDPICTKTVVLTVPRSNLLSSAIWEHNTGYIGQSILTHILECNVIDEHLFNGSADAFDSAPFTLLQQGNYTGFKSFLLQNQIGIVLVRKDDVPYAFTAGNNYVDPFQVSRHLSQDRDFKKIYENKLFTVYKLKDSVDNYGFAVPKQVTYTNLQLQTPIEYSILSKNNPFTTKQMVLQDNAYQKYADKANAYTIAAQCVGCVSITPQITVPQMGVKQQIKQFLGIFIPKYRSTPILSQDQEISKLIIDSNTEFTYMQNDINSDDTAFGIDAEAYTNILLNIQHIFSIYSGDFFAKNNKYLEWQNFLTVQNLNALLIGTDSKTSDQAKEILSLVIAKQNDILSMLKTNIWQTDFNMNIYRMRLDVPKEGDYVCAAEGEDPSIHIASVEASGNRGGNKYAFKRGSIPVTINYSVDKSSLSDVLLPMGGIRQETINFPQKGIYNLSFQVASPDTQKVMVIVSSQQITGTSSVPKDALLASAAITVNSSQSQAKSTEIRLDSPIITKAYVSFVSLGQSSSTNNNITFSHISLEKEVGNDGIQFYCKLTISKPKDSVTPQVKMLSPVSYEVSFPISYKGFLTFNQTYNTDWEAYTTVNKKIHIFDHIQDGYANAWYIDTMTNGKVIVSFRRQQWVEMNAIVSAILFVLFAVACIYLGRKYERHIS